MDRLKCSLPTCPQGSTTTGDSQPGIPHETTRGPKFRFPDLLGACVWLSFRDAPSQRRLVEYLLTQLTLRNPRTERRNCGIWAAQFELVMAAHRAPWNRFPNPMFELDQITTACVAVTMFLPDGQALVLGQARLNLRDRAARSRGLEC